MVIGFQRTRCRARFLTGASRSRRWTASCIAEVVHRRQRLQGPIAEPIVLGQFGDAPGMRGERRPTHRLERQLQPPTDDERVGEAVRDDHLVRGSLREDLVDRGVDPSTGLASRLRPVDAFDMIEAHRVVEGAFGHGREDEALV